MKIKFLYIRCGSIALGLFLLTSAAALSQQAATKAVPVEKRKVVAAPAKTEVKVKTKTEVKKQAVVVGKAARVVRQMNDDAQINALAQQFAPQFRPVLAAEFQVVRVVCSPTPEQSKKIARHAEKSFQSAVRKYAEGMRRPMTVEQRQALDPHKLIQESLLQAVLTQLSTEQSGRYHEELARRTSYRKQLAIRNLVVKLDRELVLDSAQREKLAESLKMNWSDSWTQSLNALVYDYPFLPNIPDKAIASLLNETQKKIWRGMPKNNGFFNQFDTMQLGNGEEQFEDPDLREARLAEAAEGDKNAK
jgi:hypothetical protein